MLESYAQIPATEWQFFRTHLAERTYKRGAHLQRAGCPAAHLYFLVDGLLRNYLLDDDGTERATGFIFSGDLAGDYSAAVVTRGAATINIDALRDSRVFTFPPSLLIALYDRHACWNRLGRAIVEQYIAKKDDKEHRFRMLSPEEHYHYLLAHKPHLPAQVPLRHLASYLAIRPETLSRIRRRAKASPQEKSRGN